MMFENKPTNHYPTNNVVFQFSTTDVMLLLRLGFLVHYYAPARDAMPEERLIIVVVFCSVCKPRAVIRIRVRRCVVRVRIDETAIRVGVVIRATNDTTRWKPLPFNSFIQFQVFISFFILIDLTNVRGRFRLGARLRRARFPFYSLISISPLKASREPLPEPELEDAKLAFAQTRPPCALA